MSIEIFYFPASATKNNLLDHLISLNYVKGRNLFQPGPEGTVHFFWAEEKDYKSTSGVDGSVFPVDAEGREVWNISSNWGIRTRTSIWASSFDKKFQNETIRQARKSFGGKFYNDHYGINRYTIIQQTSSTPASRGLFAVLERVTGELEKLKYAIPEELIKKVQASDKVNTNEENMVDTLKFFKRADPSRVIYNGLVPFLIATLEHFLRESFEILLKYDRDALSKISDSNRKISILEATDLTEGRITLEQIISGWYSFQNLQSIQKAFGDTFGIDVMQALRRRKRVRDKLPLLSSALGNLVSARHGVVHHYSLDYELSQEKFLNLIELVETIIYIIAGKFEEKLDVTLSAG